MVSGNVLVTGANRGIGFHLVKQLALLPEVTLVFATCRSPDDAKALQDLARETSKIQIVQLDVSDPASIKNAAKTVEEHVGDKGLNVLINNAGIYIGAPKFEDQTAEKLLETYTTNTVGPLLVTQAFLPLLERVQPQNETNAKVPIVVNMSSGAGSLTSSPEVQKLVFPLRGSGIPYYCSKAALNMITRCIAFEKPNIIAVAIHPGWVITDMGGVGAVLPGEESAISMLKTVKNLKREQSGSFLDWEGQTLPW